MYIKHKHLNYIVFLVFIVCNKYDSILLKTEPKTSRIVSSLKPINWLWS